MIEESCFDFVSDWFEEVSGDGLSEGLCWIDG